MNISHAYIASVILLASLFAAFFLISAKKKLKMRFTTMELATISFLICLLYAAVIPWGLSLSKIPGVDALVFSIPYTAILLIGLQLVPKPGCATVLIFGQGLLGQIVGRGLNPAWWPYYLMCGVVVELFLIVSGGKVRQLPVGIGVAVLRGGISYAYMYLLLAPFVWHKFYPMWYVGAKTALGVLGSVVGAYIAWRLAPSIDKVSRASV